MAFPRRTQPRHILWVSSAKSPLSKGDGSSTCFKVPIWGFGQIWGLEGKVHGDGWSFRSGDLL